MRLHVITRTIPSRPRSLRRLRKALDRATQAAEIELHHEVICDADGLGPFMSYRLLAGLRARGDYVWLMDDDDLPCDVGLAEFARVAESFPRLVAGPVLNDEHGTLSAKREHVAPPAEGQVTVCSYIMREDVWTATRSELAKAYRYQADFDYFAHVYAHVGEVTLLRKPIARQRPSYGTGEAATEADRRAARAGMV